MGERVAHSNVTAAEVAREFLGRDVGNILKFDPVARLGRDPEGVHQLRVSSRRLRYELQFVAPLIRSSSLHVLTRELGWNVKVLANARDLDVLCHLLRSYSNDATRGSLCVVLDELERQRSRERQRVRVALSSRRYHQLVVTLTRSVLDPPLRTRAKRPVGDVVTPRLYQAWDHLFQTVDDGGPSPTYDELHRIRILLKRNRYATETARGVLGATADEIVAAFTAAQTVLGTLHDHVVARTYLANRDGAVDRDLVRTPLATMTSIVADQLATSIEQSNQRWREPLERARGLTMALR